MKSVLSGIVLALILAVVAAFALSESQKESYEAFATQGARVGDPGHNLVGQKWTGDPAVDEIL